MIKKITALMALFMTSVAPAFASEADLVVPWNFRYRTLFRVMEIFGSQKTRSSLCNGSSR